MNRSWIACLVIALAAFVTGCGGMRETFDYQTARAKTAKAIERGEAAASCKTPLRVAVTSFTDARKSGVHGIDEGMGSVLAGIVAAPSTTLELDNQKSGLYVHDDRRLFALALYSELVESGCFAEVGLDPLDESQYDLVFSGTIVRSGKFIKKPLVPVPFFIGTAVSLAAAEQHALVEVDLYARLPGAQKPVISYGLAGSCSDCSKDNMADSVARSLSAGHADFIARLRGYLGRRSPAFWREVQARRDRERRLGLDPELARLAAQARVQPEPERTRLALALEDKKARLNRVIQSERETEMRWARTSNARFRAQLSATNRLANDVFDQRVRAAVVGALFAAGSAGATGSNANIQGDTQKGFDAAMALQQGPSAALIVDRKTVSVIQRVQAERAAAPAARKRALEQYRRETASLSELLAGTERPIDQPQARR